MSKKSKKQNQSEAPLLPEQIGLDSAKYEATIKYLFDRPEVSPTIGEEWYWQHDNPEFEATPLEWVQIQTVMFARAGIDLQSYSDEQVGMGLNYLMDNGIGAASSAPTHKTVSFDATLKMIEHFPLLWSECIAKRTRDWRFPIGYNEGRLGYVCYMWFDVWSVPWCMRENARFNRALWSVLKQMLSMDSREVQIAALHGIGHCAVGLGFDDEVEKEVRAFWLGLRSEDEELRSYAKAAAKGMVQ